MKTTQKTRNEIALDVAKSSGVGYFNPFIGDSATETCGKLNDGLGFVHYLLDKDLVSEDINSGVALVVQTMWAAAQFEMQIGDETKGGQA